MTTPPFYYKIQHSVILIEFDHHSGVSLSNEEPEKFHVHTIVRTPEGIYQAWINILRVKRYRPGRAGNRKRP